MPAANIVRGSALVGPAGRPNANSIRMDSDTETLKVGTGASGTSEKEFLPTDSPGVTAIAASATLGASHVGRTSVVGNAAGVAITLPAATGTGNKYRLIIGTALATGDVTVTCGSGDILSGYVVVEDDGDTTADDVTTFKAGASDEIITIDQSAGSGAVGDWLELEDFADGVWAVKGWLTGQEDPATPFSSAA